MADKGDPGAASRELTTRIARLTWIGRIVTIGASLAVAAVVVVFLLGYVAPTGHRPRGGGRGNAMVFAAAVAIGFLLPFMGLRAFFKWLMAARRARWIQELAEKHGCDAERLRRLAEALTELA